MDTQQGVAMATEVDTTVDVATATVEAVATTRVALDEDTAVIAKSSRPAVMTRIREMIPQLIERWSHTMGASRRTNSFVLRRVEGDRPEEALVEVRTDEEAEEEEDFRRKRDRY
jgi:hypothetical protein